MSKYYGKFLELKSIKKKSNKFSLETYLHYGDCIDLSLKTDEFTSKNISSLIQSDENYKYRLSFNSSFNEYKQEYTSTLTRTYLNQSDNIQFICSKDYTNMISTIKELEDINDLYSLDFVLNKENTPNENENNKSTANKFIKYSLIGFTSILLIFLISLCSSKTFGNKPVSKDKIKSSSNLSKEGALINLDKDFIPPLLYKATTKEGLPVDNYNEKVALPFIRMESKIASRIPEGNIALTFDDGPSKYTKKIADLLIENEIAGTFFFLGKNVEKYPEHVKYVHDKGLSIGSHSTNHPIMPKLSYSQQEAEVDTSMELIEEITDSEIRLFRPPYGSFGQNLKDILDARNYKMVLWDIDPRDWEVRDSDKIFNYIKNSELSGSIIILHESQAVVDALPRVIELLKDSTLNIVNLQ